MSKHRWSKTIKFLASIDAFFAGLLFFLAILLALVKRPSDLFGILTDISVHFSWDNRAFGFPAAVIVLFVAVWRSRRIYQSGAITILMQFSLGFLACVLVLLKIYLFTVALRSAIIGTILSM